MKFEKKQYKQLMLDTSLEEVDLLKVLPDFLGVEDSERIRFLAEYGSKDLRVRRVTDDELKSLHEIVNEYLVSDVRKSGVEYKQKWEDGWEENFREYMESKDPIGLIPKYITKNKYFRISGGYYSAPNPMFEVDLAKLILDFYFNKYLKTSELIIDLGSGSNHYALHMAKKNSEKVFYALDWARSSNAIAEILGKDFGLNLHGRKFDMFHPELEIPENFYNASLYTIGSLEQLGEGFEKILNWILSNDFECVLNIEPIYEFYDQSSVFDRSAAEYLLKRNWLKDYYAALEALAKDGVIELLEQKRIFGSMYHETYNVIVWRKYR